jgi:hypothetical protein
LRWRQLLDSASAGQEFLQWAPRAPRGLRFAVLLPHLDQERMEFVEERRMARQMRVQKLLGFMVVRGSRDESMPSQYPPGISIRHEERTLRRIQEDGVNRFWPQTPEVQQLPAEFFCRQGE